jgi:fumarate hydratase subunit alpha
MREIRVDLIRDCVARLCQEANFLLPPDILEALHDAAGRETSPAGQAVLDDLLKNAALARNGRIPICQDTGMAVVFAEIGQEVHITGGWFEDAIRQGVAQGYTTGYLRPSIVSDPLLRRNTGDNTPPVIHTRIVPGDQLHLTVAPKGFGSENMSAARMLSPSEGTDGIGPGGLGGKVTALALHILAWPTHIAGLPVVLNMGCHATRHAETYL